MRISQAHPDDRNHLPLSQEGHAMVAQHLKVVYAEAHALVMGAFQAFLALQWQLEPVSIATCSF